MKISSNGHSQQFWRALTNVILTMSGQKTLTQVSLLVWRTCCTIHIHRKIHIHTLQVLQHPISA